MAEQEGNGQTLEGLAQRLEALEQAEDAQRLESLERREPSVVGQELTLEGLAQRLEALESENALLRQEIEALRAFSGMGQRGEPASEFDRPARRRSLLSRVREAAPGVLRESFDYIWARYIEAGGITAYGQVQGLPPSTKPNTFGVRGSNVNPAPIEAKTGGVWGEAKGIGGIGVKGTSSRHTGVQGEGGGTGVYGKNTGGGTGVLGVGMGFQQAGVYGQNASGYGGHFSGGHTGGAQLRLQLPDVPAGPPAAATGFHTKGEIYMDRTATLFVCTQNGTPGGWRMVTTTAA